MYIKIANKKYQHCLTDKKNWKNFSLKRKKSMFSFILKRYLDRSSMCFSYDPKLCSSNFDLSPKFKIYFD